MSSDNTVSFEISIGNHLSFNKDCIPCGRRKRLHSGADITYPHSSFQRLLFTMTDGRQTSWQLTNKNLKLNTDNTEQTRLMVSWVLIMLQAGVVRMAVRVRKVSGLSRNESLYCLSLNFSSFSLAIA